MNEIVPAKSMKHFFEYKFWMASEPGYFLFLFFQFQRGGKISAVIHEVIKCY